MQRGGPKYLNLVGKEADESRAVVDALCRRVLRPAFDRGELSGHPSGTDDLVSAAGNLSRTLVTEQEWGAAMQRVCAWQDALETSSGTYDKSPVARVLARSAMTKFPTVERVSELVSEELAELYSDALDKIEADDSGAFADFPGERTCGGWGKQSAERAASLVVDVIAPYGADPDGMSSAYEKYMEEYRSQARERSVASNPDREARKAAARALGIWMPVAADIPKWEADPRTCDCAPEFERLVARVTEKMRIMRSVLQYVPRRKFSNHTVADMLANMERMRSYLKDGENRDVARKRLRRQ